MTREHKFHVWVAPGGIKIVGFCSSKSSKATTDWALWRPKLTAELKCFSVFNYGDNLAGTHVNDTVRAENESHSSHLGCWAAVQKLLVVAFPTVKGSFLCFKLSGLHNNPFKPFKRWWLLRATQNRLPVSHGLSQFVWSENIGQV